MSNIEHNTRLLIRAAQNGDDVEVQRLIPISNPKGKDSEALYWATLYGHVRCVELLIGVSDPQANGSYCLKTAAAQGHTQCVALLIPVSDPKADHSNQALLLAVHHGYTECVKLLIPVSDPKDRDSVALRIALQNGHPNCVDALYGVSDVHAALKYLQNNDMDNYNAWRSFEQRVEAERQHSVLSKEVGESAPIRKSKM